MYVCATQLTIRCYNKIQGRWEENRECNREVSKHVGFQAGQKPSTDRELRRPEMGIYRKSRNPIPLFSTPWSCGKIWEIKVQDHLHVCLPNSQRLVCYWRKSRYSYIALIVACNLYSTFLVEEVPAYIVPILPNIGTVVYSVLDCKFLELWFSKVSQIPSLQSAS